MIVDILLIVAGLALLVLGADYLVRGAVALAMKLGIAPVIVGLTVLAFGTSAPELIVSVAAAIGGQPGIALGNVVGSNIANVLVIGTGTFAKLITNHVLKAFDLLLSSVLVGKQLTQSFVLVLLPVWVIVEQRTGVGLNQSSC